MTPPIIQLNRQIAEAKACGLYEPLEAGAKGAQVPLAFVLAIGSRETNLRNIKGDGGHGRGVLQVDDRYHPIARSDQWKTEPTAVILYACHLLAGHLAWAKRRWPAFATRQHFKIAAAAYNCGRGGVLAAFDSGDCDARTTNQNYGRDVLARMAIVEQLLELSSER